MSSSRYDVIDSYLHSGAYNDVELLLDKEIFQQLKDGGKKKYNFLLLYYTVVYCMYM